MMGNTFCGCCVELATHAFIISCRLPQGCVACLLREQQSCENSRQQAAGVACSSTAAVMARQPLRMRLVGQQAQPWQTCALVVAQCCSCRAAEGGWLTMAMGCCFGHGVHTHCQAMHLRQFLLALLSPWARFDASVTCMCGQWGRHLHARSAWSFCMIWILCLILQGAQRRSSASGFLSCCGVCILLAELACAVL